jgi:DNA modification methylase
MNALATSSALAPETIEGLLKECFTLGRGDCLKWLRTLESDSVDSMVTDPPGGIGFMGNNWDTLLGSNRKWKAAYERLRKAYGIERAKAYAIAKWTEQLSKRLAECYRVLKPGAIAIIWSMPRTSHWTGNAIEMAGFEIFDTIHHTFGSGMPHSQDASKAVDAHYFMTWAKAEKWPHEMLKACRKGWRAKYGKARTFKLMKMLTKRLQRKAGLVREVVSTYRASGNAGTSLADKGGTYGVAVPNAEAIELHRTVGATDEARQWDGFGSGLRPAHETWWVCQKPFKGNTAANLLARGVGALNIDACRIPRGYTERGEAWRKSGVSAQPDAAKIAAPAGTGINLHPGGGWPANVTLGHDAACTPKGCVPDCPCAIIDEQSGHTVVRQARARNEYTGHGNTYSDDRMLHVSPGSTYSDEGGASRFFNCFWWTERDAVSTLYYAKASTSEREAGCEHLPKRKGFECVKREEGSAGLAPQSGAGRTSKGRANFHPTVKCEAHIAHLCRLACPPGGTILDPYLGSGTTAAAGIKQGFKVMGCELTAAYIPIIESRARHAVRERHRATRQLSLFASEQVPTTRPPTPKAEQLSLLGAAQ